MNQKIKAETDAFDKWLATQKVQPTDPAIRTAMLMGWLARSVNNKTN